MVQLLTSRDAREVLGVPASTFTWWIRQGIVKEPAVPGKGKGSTSVFTVQQVWAIGIAKAIRAGGNSLEFACEVATILEGFTQKQIEKAFAEGRTCLMVIRTDGELVAKPTLVSASSITDDPKVEKAREAAAKEGKSLQFYGIDTKPMWDQIVAAAGQ